MRVEILLFASLRDELGGTCTVEVPESCPGESTVGALREAFLASCPSAARLGKRILVAVNERFARDADPVQAGDTVAFLPPVAGG
ncbi:MAG TPA: molybdopterin converting factor subunit 1 [Thermoanaerobaculia bacterium]|nr:molybdopterin converting factor subunit 1 [Thermoanaerobaculia bacterium]